MLNILYLVYFFLGLRTSPLQISIDSNSLSSATRRKYLFIFLCFGLDIPRNIWLAIYIRQHRLT